MAKARKARRVPCRVCGSSGEKPLGATSSGGHLANLAVEKVAQGGERKRRETRLFILRKNSTCGDGCLQDLILSMSTGGPQTHALRPARSGAWPLSSQPARPQFSRRPKLFLRCAQNLMGSVGGEGKSKAAFAAVGVSTPSSGTLHLGPCSGKEVAGAHRKLEESGSCSEAWSREILLAAAISTPSISAWSTL